MTTKHAEIPDGIEERSARWHLTQFTNFTFYKQKVNEPSPHLAMVGHMSKDADILERVWRIGCYAVPYSLPIGMLTWQAFTAQQALSKPQKVSEWVYKHWAGVLKGMRRERRCVYTPKKYSECLLSYIEFMREGYPFLAGLDANDYEPEDYYDIVWSQIQSIKYFGRYIGIRAVEGLRRYCNIPAELPDIRSMGAWSPRKCLVYLYPDKADIFLNENAKNNKETEHMAYELSRKVKQDVPSASRYVVAAMLCEYRDAFEDRRQYPGWTLDQEPLLFNKSNEYFGDSLDSQLFWSTRKAIFPKEALGEVNGWEGTRWELTNILRDFGYVWSDTTHNYMETIEQGGDFSHPIKRKHENNDK